MTKDDVIRMAQEADLIYWAIDDACVNGEWAIVPHNPIDSIRHFAALVAAAEREECAKVAEVRWQVLKETEEAHYRLSPTPFRPCQFGLDFQTCVESRDIAEAIRARGN